MRQERGFALATTLIFLAILVLLASFVGYRIYHLFGDSESYQKDINRSYQLRSGLLELAEKIYSGEEIELPTLLLDQNWCLGAHSSYEKIMHEMYKKKSEYLLVESEACPHRRQLWRHKYDYFVKVDFQQGEAHDFGDRCIDQRWDFHSIDEGGYVFIQNRDGQKVRYALKREGKFVKAKHASLLEGNRLLVIDEESVLWLFSGLDYEHLRLERIGEFDAVGEGTHIVSYRNDNELVIFALEELEEGVKLYRAGVDVVYLRHRYDFTPRELLIEESGATFVAQLTPLERERENWSVLLEGYELVEYGREDAYLYLITQKDEAKQLWLFDREGGAYFGKERGYSFLESKDGAIIPLATCSAHMRPVIVAGRWQIGCQHRALYNLQYFE